MMNYNEFKAGLTSALEEAFGFDHKIVSGTVMKANLGEVESIEIRNDSAGVVIYPQERYESYLNGASIDDMVRGITEGVRNMPSASDFDFSREAILDKVFYKMKGIPGNEAYLADIPYTKAEGFDDIALVPCIEVQVGTQYGTTTIKDNQLSSLNITPEELHKAATQNTDKMVQLRPLSEVLGEMMGQEAFMFDSPFYIATDSRPQRGAAPIGSPAIMKQIQEQMGDHYVIPSSIHEILILPASFVTDVKNLQGIVGEVNSQVLDPSDKLADSVYVSEGGKYTTYSFSGANAGSGSAMQDGDGLVNYGPKL